jgi:hypothetical protein
MMAVVAFALAIGSAQAQTIIDNNGNVVGQIYDNRPGYGEQPEMPMLGDHYRAPETYSVPNTSSGFDFYNYERGLQMAQRWVDRERAKQAQEWAMAARGAWATLPEGCKIFRMATVPGVAQAIKRGDYLGACNLIAA